jgi:hypothetical protein
MKKTLIGLTALALVLFLAAGATAKAPAPPKNLCLQLGGGFEFVKFSLVVKLAGTINTASGPVKFYTISGEHFYSDTDSAPITGTGHMKGTKFHFTLTGSYKYGSVISTLDASSVDYDPVTQSGTLFLHYINSNVVNTTGIYTLEATDCKASAIPLDAQSGQAPYPPGQ